MKIQLVCQQCKQPFTVEHKDRDRVYCSTGCYNEMRRAKVTALICAHCGKPFTQLTRFRRSDPRQYCSIACYRAFYCPVPDLEASNPLAYLVGVLMGDGHANDRQFIVQVTDRAFAAQCFESLGTIGLRPTIHRVAPKRVNRREQWRVVASSTPLARWMSQLTVSSIAVLFSDPSHRREFIRGFFESEGSVSQHLRQITAPHARPTDPSYNRLYASTRLTMTNINKELLELVQVWAAERGHKFALRFQRTTNAGNKAFELCMTSQPLIELFLADIQPVVKIMPADALPVRKKLLEINGQTHSIPEWANRFGMHPDKLKSRLKRGWSIERAIIP